MTIAEAMNAVEESRPGGAVDAEKLLLLCEIERRIFDELIATHEGGEAAPRRYDATTDADTALFAPVGYDALYLRFLESRIDYLQGEIARYNVSAAAFNEAYASFAAYYNRAHLPRSQAIKYY